MSAAIWATWRCCRRRQLAQRQAVAAIIYFGATPHHLAYLPVFFTFSPLDAAHVAR